MSKALRDKDIADFGRPSRSIEGLNPLSPREQDVLAEALSGARVAEIARTLHLSAGAVRNYLSTTTAKSQARSSAEAAVIARDRGWV
jgi:two-component system, NarL family, response regulator DesR